MKQFFFSFALALSLALSFETKAQGGGKVHAVKVGFISDRLKLSAEQAERFWPVYNRCSDERRGLRQNLLRKQGGRASDPDEAMEQIDNNLEYQEQELALRKRCKEEYLKVLSPQQVAALFDAERDFKKMLLEQIRERHGNRN